MLCLLMTLKIIISRRSVFFLPQPQFTNPLLYIWVPGLSQKTNDDVNTPEQAIRALAENARLEMKEKAIGILVRNKSDEATKALTSSLIDPAPEIREAAIAGLASFGNHDVLPEIIKCLKDKDPKVRLSAATAVAYLGKLQEYSGSPTAERR